MILTILGGGGFRVPLVYRALLNDRLPGRVTHIRLYDTDPARLTATSTVCRELANGDSDAPEVSVHTDLTEAVRRTDVVFSAIRVGGLEARALDERLPMAHGLIGQETVGAGGISYALRTIPEARRIARTIAARAPEAWVINFTNPAGIVTESLREILGDRVVGICDSPVGLARRSAHAIGLSPDVEVLVEYAGLNHLGWLTGLRVDGEDRLPELLAAPDRIESFEEGRLFGADWIRALGAVPNEYLHQFYFAREALQADRQAGPSRAQVIQDQQRDFYRVADVTAPGALRRWEQTRLARERTYMASNRATSGGFERDQADLESGGYDQVALAIMHAIAHDTASTLIVNTANRGRLDFLDDDAVIEAPCRVMGNGIHPLPITALPDHAVGLVSTVKYVERQVLLAAHSGSRKAAWRALASHPLVDSVRVASALLDDLVAAHPQLHYLK